MIRAKTSDIFDIQTQICKRAILGLGHQALEYCIKQIQASCCNSTANNQTTWKIINIFKSKQQLKTLFFLLFLLIVWRKLTMFSFSSNIINNNTNIKYTCKQKTRENKAHNNTFYHGFCFVELEHRWFYVPQSLRFDYICICDNWQVRVRVCIHVTVCLACTKASIVLLL